MIPVHFVYETQQMQFSWIMLAFIFILKYTVYAVHIHGDVESECLITGPLPYRRAANHWNGEPPPPHPPFQVGRFMDEAALHRSMSCSIV